MHTKPIETNNIAILNAHLATLEEEYATLDFQSTQLRNQFKAEFPAKRCPVFLARDSAANTPLYWRYSSTAYNKLGARVSTKNNEFWKIIQELSDADAIRLHSYELGRINLNYELSTKKYVIGRIKDLITQKEQWIKNVKQIDKETIC